MDTSSIRSPVSLRDSGLGGLTDCDLFAYDSPGPDILPSVASSRQMKPSSDGYHCSTCNRTYRTESEFKKDQKRHQKPYRCELTGCPRNNIGFGTVNDLNRHLKSIHKHNVAGARDWKCFVPGCSRAEKTWPRLDNFRQHVTRMHPDEDLDKIVFQSQHWYDASPSQYEHASFSRKVEPVRWQRQRAVPWLASGASDAGIAQGGRPLALQTLKSKPTIDISGQRPFFTSSKNVHPRRLSLSSVPDVTSNADRLGLEPFPTRRIVTEGHRTPEPEAVHFLESAPVDNGTTDWSWTGPSELFAPDLFLSTTTEDIGNVTLPKVESDSLPRIEILPPSRVVTPAHNIPESNDDVDAMSTDLVRLQEILASYKSVIAATLDIDDEVVDADGEKQNGAPGSSQQRVLLSSGGSQNPKSGPRRKFDGLKRRFDDNNDDEDRSGEGRPKKRRRKDYPGLYIACQFHKHDPMVFAACHIQRKETVEAMYRHHILVDHVEWGHIGEEMLARLDTLTQHRHRSPVERWQGIYRTLFATGPQVAAQPCPDPYWRPTFQATNLDDLVRGLVEISGTRMDAGQTVQDNQIQTGSLVPFYRRLERIQNIVNMAREAELQLVRRRWHAVQTQSVDRLATGASFSPSVLSGMTMAQHEESDRRDTTQGHGNIAPPFTSPDLLTIDDNAASMPGREFPSPPLALPPGAYAFSPSETPHSRQSTPHDSGYESKGCAFSPSDFDSSTCSRCNREKDRHTLGVSEGFVGQFDRI